MNSTVEYTYPKRILVVEDDAAVALLVRDVLVSYGYSVETADDLSVFQATREHLPDLILLDVIMPSTSGVDAARRLKESPETSDIPIVLMSAADDLAQLAAVVGAAGYLGKPFALDDLLAAVAHVLSSAGHTK